ncbi:hypothetical protein GCM10020358_59590 [Amorphoplanes nipponensis]|uniref:Uncharacterized protein n=1 Tax=Actinoplanes nipponensis TaxID=135950 RepID=A0A919JC89_9ACTN|nr:hypothetical protein Ani05nite_04710 [Actinoplanes nipponensis]
MSAYGRPTRRQIRTTTEAGALRVVATPAPVVVSPALARCRGPGTHSRESSRSRHARPGWTAGEDLIGHRSCQAAEGLVSRQPDLVRSIVRVAVRHVVNQYVCWP